MGFSLCVHVVVAVPVERALIVTPEDSPGPLLKCFCAQRNVDAAKVLAVLADAFTGEDGDELPPLPPALLEDKPVQEAADLFGSWLVDLAPVQEREFSGIPKLCGFGDLVLNCRTYKWRGPEPGEWEMNLSQVSDSEKELREFLVTLDITTTPRLVLLMRPSF